MLNLTQLIFRKESQDLVHAFGVCQELIPLDEGQTPSEEVLEAVLGETASMLSGPVQDFH
jgi:hypothetical protein